MSHSVGGRFCTQLAATSRQKEPEIFELPISFRAQKSKLNGNTGFGPEIYQLYIEYRQPLSRYT